MTQTRRNLQLLATPLLATFACAHRSKVASDGPNAPAAQRHQSQQLEAQCSAGDAESCRLRGVDYQTGHGVRADPKPAADFYDRACDRQNGRACYNLGVLIMQGAELDFQPELTGGFGLSTTTGVAAFPSGEVYRVGDPKPVVLPARLFLRQVIGLGGGKVGIEGGPNQLAGLAFGATQSGSRWGRPADQAGLAMVISGESVVHRKYLAAGGYGFIVGVNPAFNPDRGPIHVFSGRVHVEL